MLRIFEKSANADVVEEESTDTDSRVKDSRILRVNITVRQGSSAYFGIKVWILDFISDKININLYRKKES